MVQHTAMLTMADQ